MQKSRSTPGRSGVCYQKQYDSKGKLIATNGPYHFSLPGTFERITYDNGKHTFNYCDHVKYKMNWQKPLTVTYTNPDGSRNVSENEYNDVPITGPSQVPVAPLPKNGVDQFILRGVQNIRPRFKADLSVPNFIFELKDLKRLIPNQATIASYADALSNASINPFSKKGQRLIERGSDATASQLLNAKFGYLPLIEDIGKLIESINTFNMRLDQFVKQAGKVQVGHYKEVVNHSEESLVYTSRTPYIERFKYLRYGQCTYTLTLAYGYNIGIPRLNVPKVFLKYLGFRANPRILWDAIPFSFVLDWVLRFGKALESFDEGAIPVSFNIVRAGISVSYTCKMRNVVSGIPNTPGNWSFGQNCTESSEFWEVYKRSPIELNSLVLGGLPPLPTFDGLSNSEITLGAALGKTLTSRRR